MSRRPSTRSNFTPLLSGKNLPPYRVTVKPRSKTRVSGSVESGFSPTLRPTSRSLEFDVGTPIANYSSDKDVLRTALHLKVIDTPRSSLKMKHSPPQDTRPVRQFEANINAKYDLIRQEKEQEEADKLRAEVLKQKLSQTTTDVHDALLQAEEDQAELDRLQQGSVLVPPPALDVFAQLSAPTTPTAPPDWSALGAVGGTPEPTNTIGAPAPPLSLSLGALPKNTPLLKNSLSSPSIGNLTRPSRTELQRLEEIAVKRQRQYDAMSRVRRDEDKISRDLRAKQTEILTKSQIRKEKKLAVIEEMRQRVMNEDTEGSGDNTEDEGETDGETEGTNETEVDLNDSNTLWGQVSHLSKAVSKLNVPGQRDTETTTQRVRQHLEKVSERGIATGVELILGEYGETADQKLTSTVALSNERIRSEMLQYIDENYGARLLKIEQNERLTSRAATEKKDALRPCAGHPSQDADPEAVRKAHLQMNLVVRSANLVFDFRKSPFNWTAFIASESNKISLTHQLSESQHMELIITTLPSLSQSREYLEMCKTLAELFELISTNSTSIVTRVELEQKINAWKLNNESKDSLFDSVCEIYSLLNRNRDNYGIEPPHPPTLFRQIITRCQALPDIPHFLRESLGTSRLRIRDTDRVDELNMTLMSSLLKFIGVKTRSAQVKSINVNPPVPFNSSVPPPAPHFGSSSAAPVYAVPPPPVPAPKKKKKKKGAKVKAVQAVGGNQVAVQAKPQFVQAGHFPPVQNQSQQIQNKSGTKGNFRTNFPRFVKPWDMSIPYLTKSGNGISKACEMHFKDHCHRCGFGGHQADSCKTYTDRNTILTICSRCCQGFHETCKSKRRDLLSQEALVKRMEQLFTELHVQTHSGGSRDSNAKSNTKALPQPDSDSE